MGPLPDVIPISDFRVQQNELLSKLSDEPVILTQHGRTVAVLLGPDYYNRLMEQLEDLQLALDAVEARQDPDPVVDFEDYLTQRGESVPAASER